jgi:hypothetical protein
MPGCARPQKAVHWRQQFPRAERLRHLRIGAHREQVDIGHPIASRGEHDYAGRAQGRIGFDAENPA